MSQYTIGDIVAIKGSSPYWSDLEADVEIMGMSKLQKIVDLGIPFYNTYFSGKGIDSLYNTYLTQNIDIYLARNVYRDPYRVETNTDTPSVTFIYFADELLDLNTSMYLIRRSTLKVPICIGNINTDNITDDLKTELNTLFQTIINNYTSTGYIGSYSATTILQTKTIADFEDGEFIRLKAEREAEAAEKAKVEADRLALLIARENSIIAKETEIAAKQLQLNTDIETLNAREAVLDNRVSALNSAEIALDVRTASIEQQELNLSNKQYLLHTQIELLRSTILQVNAKESELGLTPTEFDLTGLTI